MTAVEFWIRCANYLNELVNLYEENNESRYAKLYRIKTIRRLKYAMESRKTFFFG